MEDSSEEISPLGVMGRGAPPEVLDVLRLRSYELESTLVQQHQNTLLEYSEMFQSALKHEIEYRRNSAQAEDIRLGKEEAAAKAFEQKMSYMDKLLARYVPSADIPAIDFEMMQAQRVFMKNYASDLKKRDAMYIETLREEAYRILNSILAAVHLQFEEELANVKRSMNHDSHTILIALSYIKDAQERKRFATEVLDKQAVVIMKAIKKDRMNCNTFLDSFSSTWQLVIKQFASRG